MADQRPSASFSLPAYSTLPGLVHQVSREAGQALGSGCTGTCDWVSGLSLRAPAAGWLWHRVSFLAVLGSLLGVVEDTALSWVAGLPCLLSWCSAATGCFSPWPSCKGQVFLGDGMGAT